MNEPSVAIDQTVISKEKADIGNIRFMPDPYTDASHKYRAAVAPESYYKL